MLVPSSVRPYLPLAPPTGDRTRDFTHHPMASPELVKALYPYTGGDQAVPLQFASSAVLLVAERTADGWCRGFSAGKEGWFPASYATPLDNTTIAQVRERFSGTCMKLGVRRSRLRISSRCVCTCTICNAYPLLASQVHKVNDNS